MEIDGKQKALAIGAHLGYLACGVGFVIVPLVIYLCFDKKDYFVAEHAKQALIIQAIFAITEGIIAALSVILIGLLLTPIAVIIGVVWFVCSFIGAWKALQGEYYHYPLLG